MKASEKTEENQDEKRPKPVFQESSSLYPNLIDLETELSPPPYADPNPPLLPQQNRTQITSHIDVEINCSLLLFFALGVFIFQHTLEGKCDHNA
ncbi:hypothetical protein MJT46_009154 [Ovis ammon polii x Ovis aries]|nr:hypothetical protein MJT46_009154 [Ovis ammon polii x Ovis aries]